MIDKSIVFCLLVRDCEINLAKNIERIEFIRKEFAKSYVVVVENDSKDGTKDVLYQWEKTGSGIFIDCRNYTISPVPEYPIIKPIRGGSRYRLEKMAFFRNRYLDIIRDKNLVADYVAVIDGDLDSFSYKNFVPTIVNAPADWKCIFSNGVFYASLFGVKISLKCYDCLAYLPYNTLSDELTYREMQENMDDLAHQLKKSDYVKCDSAFGGIGIYHYEDLIAAHYTSKENNRSNALEAVCEHISVNAACRKNGCNYIAREMRTFYQKRCFFSPFMFFSNRFIIRLYEFLKKKSYPA